ncbi:hypothetical protein GCM10025881_13940 [Pseudolysinimonas kribbensis]|uniref:Uncharacterized protein n=1 Tax=Pseudolysinimonas kribbensis TaxID=433641 RepID=A0ABQ6K6C0_9MICO|nr:hypothetical protein GCM10025881_13940 [Pseudolysinimonas kribbensis]
MAAGLEVGDDVVAEAILHGEPGRGPGARLERADVRGRVRTGTVDRGLRGPAADEPAQQVGELPLVLLVAPGVPSASTARLSRSRSVGLSVVRGRIPGRSAVGDAGSSQAICNRVPSAKPISGTVGDDCSQPPDGVTDTMLPQRSITSRWQVSPRGAPLDRRSTVGSPVPGGLPASSPSVLSGGIHGVRPCGLPGR